MGVSNTSAYTHRFFNKHVSHSCLFKAQTTFFNARPKTPRNVEPLYDGKIPSVSSRHENLYFPYCNPSIFCFFPIPEFFKQVVSVRRLKGSRFIVNGLTIFLISKFLNSSFGPRFCIVLLKKVCNTKLNQHACSRNVRLNFRKSVFMPASKIVIIL